MLFNSIDFMIFLPLVFLIYWFIVNKNLKIQNLFLLIASYVFYGWWDWRFLFLIMFSTLIDFFVGAGLAKEENERKRRALVSVSIIANLAFLGFFKYYNFFVDNFVAAFSFFGMKFSAFHLKIVLPVGISFYTFQTMSYSIDIYRRKMEPTGDIIAFSAFVSFFPQLVAGPIERAGSLLPQFYKRRMFEYDAAVEACKQMLWGFFKKIVIADNCAVYVNKVFESFEYYQGSSLLLAAVFFAFQIYGDFSGYSDIAIGTAKLFGFRLMKNFAFPYFSRDIAEFWRRWHISLTTWFRDYIYIPLGGSRRSIPVNIRNTFIIFLVSGFWHGADWTFILWGCINALYFLPLLLLKKNRVNLDVPAAGRALPNLKELSAIFATFALTVFAWIFFRAETTGKALKYIAAMVSPSLFTKPAVISDIVAGSLLLSIPLMIVAEWINRNEEYGFKRQWKNKFLRRAGYIIIILLIIELAGDQQGFIYFQF